MPHLLISSRLANIIATKSRQSRKPMVVFSLYGPFTDQHLLEFHDRGVAAFGSMSRTVEALWPFGTGRCSLISAGYITVDAMR